MFFQIYGETAGWQLLGWLLVFTGLVLMNEVARRTKWGGIACFLILPAVLTVYFIAIYIGAAAGAEWALLLAPTFAAALWNKGGWIQNRANTLALWCMFAQVFPLFQDASRFTTVTSVYGEGGIAAAMGSTMPVTANPTAQGLISVIAFAVNVFSFAYILKQAKVQKKNPWKEEIFVDTKDYQEAMARTR